MLLYALTTVVSAFLLFQVQPVIAKIILPWFGGSAAVWTTCLLFFQMALLLGYLYAHALVRYMKPRTQMILHGAVLLASTLALPIYPAASWKPTGAEEPTFRILGLLAVTIGLPYFLLSTTGPLLQAWYARRFKGAMPYRLYALSNAGSMFALLSYPFLFEPSFTTHQQSSMWGWGYGVFVILCGITAFRSGSDSAAASSGAAGPDAASPAERPTAARYTMWIALPAVASVLLLAITNHLSQNVAAIPFLWVLPLSIYLLSFILCFEGEGWYYRNPYLQLLAVALGGMAYAVNVDTVSNVPIFVMVPLFGIGLFICCMVCHGELVRLKPHPQYLTHFYLMMSAGGALGGLVVGLLAPHFFKALYEMPLSLAVCAVIAVCALQANPDWPWLRNLLPPSYLLAAVIAAGAVGFGGQTLWTNLASHWARVSSLDEVTRATLMMCGLVLWIAMALAFLHGGGGWMRRGGAWASFTVELLALVLVGYVGNEIHQLTSGYRVVVRNFYGGLRVRDSAPADALDATRTLTHGTINHGEEYLHFTRRHLATTYYGPNTGVGIVIREKQRTGAIRVGVVGLGTGTIASYGRLGDYYRYYEINPLILNLARTEFFFLPDCKAQTAVAMGDARLSLERESPQNFDVLAVDAFSSDSIPVHLLTSEAMDLYFRHLRPDGILAVHISNRYLDLQPVLKGEADVKGRIGRVVDTEDDDTQDVFGATWVLIASPVSGFTQDELNNSAPLQPKRTVRLWTDDYSNLFKILK